MASLATNPSNNAVNKRKAVEDISESASKKQATVIASEKSEEQQESVRPKEYEEYTETSKEQQKSESELVDTTGKRWCAVGQHWKDATEFCDDVFADCNMCSTRPKEYVGLTETSKEQQESEEEYVDTTGKQ